MSTATIALLTALACCAAAADGPDYDQHLADLRQQLPAETYTIVLTKPFVVIGDESPDRVRQRARQTVAWAVTHLKKRYFEKDPPDIIDIWLLKDRDSYERHMRDRFGVEPTTPFGCYLPAQRALVMNIATGGGTLVHEIVHPFMAANFQGCPAWFNEGLGSLYEQSAERDGEIVGLTNWRLTGLQKTIRAGKLSTFAQLCATSNAQFYNDERGTHYAMARYLCYYLQEHDLLPRFYREFAANCKDDPTGYATLQSVLGEEDMPAFQQRWQAFVMKLTFP